MKIRVPVHQSGSVAMDAKVYGDNACKARRNWRRKLSRHQRLERSLRPVLKGESDLVLSYTTSPAYRILEERKITTPPRTSAKVTCKWKSPPAPLPASSQSWRKIPPVYGFSGFSECDPNRQLDVSGSKRPLPAGFEQLTKPAARVHARRSGGTTSGMD